MCRCLSVSVGILTERAGESEREREGERLIGVARWPRDRPARSSFCYDPEIRPGEATCVRDGILAVLRERATSRSPVNDLRLVPRSSRTRWRTPSKVEVVVPVRGSVPVCSCARDHGSQQVTSMKGKSAKAGASLPQRIRSFELYPVSTFSFSLYVLIREKVESRRLTLSTFVC